MDPFAERLLAWHQREGRKDLPWQREATPYRVWISEIMLQQTRVKTVLGYFERFTARFPEVRPLADAPLDEVLHLWSGLGYYARARNVHRAARILRDRFGGRFPRDIAELIDLPGIGRSTAGAILALSRGERHPILDGNVKRVLSRYHGIDGWPGHSPIRRKLWELADLHTPQERLVQYTQAVMDLGATLCTRARPRCDGCPLSEGCTARRLGLQASLPAARPKKALPVRQTVFLIVRNQADEVLLAQRPPAGIWGGLWGFPECPPDTDPRHWCHSALGGRVVQVEQGPSLRHTFSHFHLDIRPVYLRLNERPERVMEAAGLLWYNPLRPVPVGLAAPVAKLMKQLRT